MAITSVQKMSSDMETNIFVLLLKGQRTIDVRPNIKDRKMDAELTFNVWFVLISVLDI